MSSAFNQAHLELCNICKWIINAFKPFWMIQKSCCLDHQLWFMASPFHVLHWKFCTFLLLPAWALAAPEAHVEPNAECSWQRLCLRGFAPQLANSPGSALCTLGSDNGCSRKCSSHTELYSVCTSYLLSTMHDSHWESRRLVWAGLAWRSRAWGIRLPVS